MSGKRKVKYWKSYGIQCKVIFYYLYLLHFMQVFMSLTNYRFLCLSHFLLVRL